MKTLIVAVLATALTLSTSFAKSKMPEVGTGTVVGAIAGVALVSNPVGLAVGAFLGWSHDKTNDRLDAVEYSSNLAHERLNGHDETFNSLKDYLERQDGRASKEVQETRKTTAQWPWELGR